MKIVTSFDYPPIPDRSMDWSAIDDDTYDGASDSNCPVGRGPTEQAAIDDLKEQIAERQGTCSHFTENCPICNPLEARHV